MASFLLVFSALFLDSFVIITVAESTAVIETNLGPVQGEILTTVGKRISYSSFKGIPYGNPLNNGRRFGPPIFIEPWSDVLNATSKGCDCLQLNFLNISEHIGEENCLFLNVFTPVTNLIEIPDELKAVMFWIHGGGFTRDSSDPDSYGPDFLIENDVVVVTFNYRLGALGFLALNTHEATGNAGLKDQLLALKWVQSNIDKFGGDPSNVTIFGQGAGGASALYHALSDQSQGLFSGIISMSGAPLNSWAFERSSKAKEKAIELGRSLGTTTDDMDELFHFLNSVSAEKLLRNSATIPPQFMPILEDSSIALNGTEFLTKCMVDQYESGNFSWVPYILGFMNEETLSFTGTKRLTSELLSSAKAVTEDFNLTFTTPNLSEPPSKDWITDMVRETTDLLYISGIERTKTYISSKGLQPLYYYHISAAPVQESLHARYLNVNDSGAADGDDVAYIWWVSDAGMSLDPNDKVSIIREKMTRMWTNFAKYGNPTPNGTDDQLLNFTWPDYSSTLLHLNIDEEMSVEQYVNEKSDKIIEDAEWFLRVAKGCRD